MRIQSDNRYRCHLFQCREFSLLDEAIDSSVSVSFKYSDLSHAEIEEASYEAKNGSNVESVPTYLFKIIKKDGSEAFKMYIEYGADSDKAVENINRTIQVRTEELQKLAEEKAKKLAEFRAKVAKDAEKEAQNNADAATADNTTEEQ